LTFTIREALIIILGNSHLPLTLKTNNMAQQTAAEQYYNETYKK
jgi:hypothetical protein